MTVNHVNPTKRDEFAIALGKHAVLWSARPEDDNRGKAEFQVDGLIEEGLLKP